jgi:Zn-dependent protease
MSRRVDSRVILLRRPVPVVLGRGGLAPVAGFALLFAVFAAHVGASVPAAAITGALGGTASLVIHELGHVRAARRIRGLEPTDVSLIWLGAATRMEGAYSSGRDQIRVAIAGPGASLSLALLFGAAAVLPLPESIRDGLLMLVFLNVVIAVLNLLPVSPLDGHKVILGLTWRVVGSERSARTILRRLGSVWLAAELVGVCILAATNPTLGSLLVVAGASLYGQRVFARRSHG